MKIAKLSIIIATLLFAILAAGAVSATNLNITSIKINGWEVSDIEVTDYSNNLQVRRGETLNIEVRVKAEGGDAEGVEILGDILGYRHSDRERDLVSDRVRTFDLNENDTTVKRLTLQIPVRMDQDYLKLRIRVGDRDSPGLNDYNYQLNVYGFDDREALVIQDVIFNPEVSVVAGRALLTSLRLRNYGDNDIRDVRVNVAIPALGISASDYINRIESDSSESSEELYMRIPACAAQGQYKVILTADYDYYESTSVEKMIYVVKDADAICSDDKVTDTSIVTVGPASQNVEAGAGVVYPITITNPSSQARTYIITVSGADAWAETTINPSNTMVLNAKETGIAYITVNAKDRAAAGSYSFSVSVASGTETIGPFTLGATVMGKPSSWGNLRTALGISLVVLVIVLVVLGLIIGARKMKNKEGSSDEDQTYY